MKNNLLREQLKFPNRQLSNFVIPSRFFLAPINTGFAERGYPTESFIEFYRRRSGRKIGITYIGNVAIGEKWIVNPNTPYLVARHQDIWKDLTKIIEHNGSIPGIQLACSASKKKRLKDGKENTRRNLLSK